MSGACECSIPDGRKPPRRGALARGKFGCHLLPLGCINTCLLTPDFLQLRVAVEQRELKRREQDAARQEVERWGSEHASFPSPPGC
jgi:hypothetical protein